jgi:N-acetylmuramoyl-L-alanine amidase
MDGVIILEAGHVHLGKDQGAAANGYKEADLTYEFRELVKDHLIGITAGVAIITDHDDVVLVDMVNQVNKLMNADSISLSIHFNAGPESATGTEVIYPTEHSVQEKEWSTELSKLVADHLGIKNRGAKDETATARGKIYIRSMKGHNLLLEVCFITNLSDLSRYQKNKKTLAQKVAEFLKEKYDAINPTK